jgi:hypothetical protein
MPLPIVIGISLKNRYRSRFQRARIKVVPFVVKANTRGRSNMQIEDTERLVTEIEMIRLYCV